MDILPLDPPLMTKRRACFHCAKSKLRCDWPDDHALDPSDSTQTCRRCGRQGYACWVTEPAKRGPRPGTTTKVAKTSRVRQLEKRLDGIMSLLSTRPPGIVDLNLELPGSRLSNQVPFLPTDDSWATATFDTVLAAGPFSPELHNAERILEAYRSEFYPRFPFVPVPADVSAYQIHIQQPFLLKVITHIVAPSLQPGHDWEDRSVFHRWFRRCVAEEVVREERKTLEMLQAILVFATWGDYYLSGDPKGSDLTQLAISLVVDLGLNVAAGSGTEVHHTLQEQRAMLGCFYLCSAIRPVLKQQGALHFNEYMERCCDKIEEEGDEPADLYLVGLVRLQVLASRPPAGSRGLSAADPSSTADQEVYRAIMHIQADTERIAHGLPESVRVNALLWTVNHQAILVRAFGAVIDRPAADALPESARRRTQAMLNCMRACGDAVEAFLSIPPAHVAIACPMTTMCSVGIALLTVRCLLLLGNDPHWDVVAARRTVDFATLLARLSQQFEEACDIYRQAQLQRPFTTSEDFLGGSVRETAKPAGDAAERQVSQDIGGHRAVPAVNGYWKKIRRLRVWYLSELSIRESVGDTVVDRNEGLDDLLAAPGPLVGANATFWEYPVDYPIGFAGFAPWAAGEESFPYGEGGENEIDGR